MITGNEPAMPTLEQTSNPTRWTHAEGLTIRQHFAAMAMQGLQSIFSNRDMAIIYQEQSKEFKISLQENLAAIAVRQADALIAELNKTA